jgi:sterol desaturase/sphingolipid hydroxylase (fatty acid hydroxylase superfamily)
MLYLMIAGALAISGVLMASLTAYYKRTTGTGLHLRESKSRPVTDAQFRKYASINSVLSFAMVFGPAYALEQVAFHTGPVGILRSIGEGVAILFVYDFFYYFLHRYPFHEWTLLRRFHAVHHAIRNPNALDSLYQHPVEAFLGLSTMWLAVLLVGQAMGPVSIYTFGWMFAVYSAVNVLVHAGLDFKRFPLTIVTYLGARHYKHHTSMKHKNYANVTPVYDMIFRTEEP